MVVVLILMGITEFQHWAYTQLVNEVVSECCSIGIEQQG